MRDFLKLKEKEIKAEMIDEEEEKISEASAGAKTGVSDLVPTLNLTEDVELVEVSDNEEANGEEVDGDGEKGREGDEAQGSGGRMDGREG